MKRKKSKVVASSLRSGVYRHYKGPYYWVLGVAKHSETEADFVVYVRLYARGGCPWWIRPLEHFTGKVTGPDGKKMARFAFVGSKQPSI